MKICGAVAPRGMGGNPDMDVEENLIAGCRFCHDGAEASLISKDLLKQIAKERIDARISG